MSTNGKSFRTLLKLTCVGIVAMTLVISRSRSKKSLDKLSKDPTLVQYLNRLIEFFEPEQLPYAEDDFLTMVDFGVYPHEAFRIVTHVGEDLD
jgi:hypothetical protein